MAIADEASYGAGYLADSNQSWIADFANAILGLRATPASGHVKHWDGPCSITSNLVNQDAVCVQPKSRTPAVGCSLRNLSHNLSLLPPRGEVRVHWLTSPKRQSSEHEYPLNLLLVPYPYVIEDNWFHAEIIEDDADGGWGWFELRQEWLKSHRKEFLNFVDALLDKAETPEAPVHGLVFPEYSLDYEMYETLVEHLRKRPSMQFLVAGTSENCNEERGNYALATHLFTVGGNESAAATVSRPKHHRWTLDEGQLKAYGVTSFPKSKAKGKMKWWEDIPLHPRRIHVNALRSSSVFSAMICEDLARSDPVHEPLRAVGPNLVFVLLMDGPQLDRRWATRYSTGLAEDPGSSVLTMTSRALLARWNNQPGLSEPSWNIAIWKDEHSRAQAVTCPPDAQAVLITLKGSAEREVTVDGRTSRESFSWRMIKDRTIKLNRRSHARLIKLFCESQPN